MNTHRRQLISLAHPVYLSLLASVAAGIINTVWVARLGGPAVAAVAVATTTENVLLGIALVFASGTTVLVAHARGARDPAALRSAVRGGWALCALVTPMVVTAGFLLRAPLSRLLLGGTGPELPLTVAYFTISLPGIAVFYVQQLVDGILKGTGDTRTPMRLALLANGLILVCDPFLIHLYGVRGAAASTVLCRVLALGVGLRALRRNALLRTKSVPSGPLSAAPPRGQAVPGRSASAGPASARTASAGPASTEPASTEPAPAESAPAGPAPTRSAPTQPLSAALRRTFATGLPMSADFTVRQGGALVLVAVVARLGVTAVAAYAIGYKVLYLATMAFYSVRQAASIHTAHLRGTGKDARREIGRQAMLVSGAVGVLAAVLLCATAPWIMAAFGTGPQVAHEGALFLRCVGPYLLLMACFIALGGVFEGSGGAPALFRVTVLGTAVQLPLAYGLSGFGLPGVCLAMALSMGVQCAVVAVLFRRDRARPADRGGAGERRPVDAGGQRAVRTAVRRHRP
ncbi:MATE family efflux transporter [Streptomyces sp. STR69]|uniref:MATE family efflux transporter n=1 Tax=Streptomyces sp. STR69 TaxID=1796942 RepID=UPI0021C6CF66|nr:MATE family efflux transporter [Streptomyces sp. STR69]